MQDRALAGSAMLFAGSASAALAGPWKDLWNCDLSVTDVIIAEDFTPMQHR
jgi:hypothetical protein